jgi:pyroglutamyl-peptidase
MMRVLVTGFEPYGGRGRNPALEAMKALNGRTIAGATVAGRSLPVVLAPLAGLVGELLDEVKPDIVVGLGLCPGEAAIRLERVGVNLADFPIADNEGQTLRNTPLIDGGAASYFSTLPLAQILDALLAAGIPARMSMTAGTYLCNACLYHVRAAIERERRALPAGFIHLPDLPEQVAASLATSNEETCSPSMELSRMIRAVEIAIATTAERARLARL